MNIDPNNNVIKLCAKGMEMEGLGDNEEASRLFLQAWDEANDDVEKFTAAHYVARHQQTIADKLHWDETALHLAKQIPNDLAKEALASLYLNVAKCYEDLGNIEKAREYYQNAHASTDFLPDNEYGNMIKNGIANGLKRVIQ